MDIDGHAGVALGTASSGHDDVRRLVGCCEYPQDLHIVQGSFKSPSVREHQNAGRVPVILYGRYVTALGAIGGGVEDDQMDNYED